MTKKTQKVPCFAAVQQDEYETILKEMNSKNTHDGGVLMLQVVEIALSRPSSCIYKKLYPNLNIFFQRPKNNLNENGL